MTNPSGGPARPVYVVSASEQRENGGPYATEGHIAIPVYGYEPDTLAGRAVEGGPALPVRVITDADLVQNGGRYRLEGRPTAMPIYEIGRGTRPIQGGPAIPVYAVNYIPPSPALYPLFLDRFITDQVSVASPRNAEPGPGQWIFVQNLAPLSISGGRLVSPNFVGTSFSQGGYTNTQIARTVGRALLATHRRDSTTGASVFGWFSGAGVTVANIASRAFILISGTSGISGTNSALNAPLLMLAPYSGGIDYQLAAVLRGNGVFLLIKGGGFTRWTLLMADDAGSTTPLRVGFSNGNSSSYLDNVRVTDFPAPWTSDYGIATSRSAVVASGATATSTSNAWVWVDWTAAAGETMELSFRRIDDNNRLIARCIKNSNVIRIIKVEAGVETQLDSDAQTWTTGTTYRVAALFDGTGISTLVRSGTTWAGRNNVTSSFNQSATGVKVAGGTTLANLECYPRDVDALVPSGI